MTYQNDFPDFWCSRESGKYNTDVYTVLKVTETNVILCVHNYRIHFVVVVVCYRHYVMFSL